MEKPGNDNHAIGGRDIEQADPYRDETDRNGHGDDRDTLDPDDLPDAAAVRAALRYGRDRLVVRSGIDPDEDHDAPRLREQDSPVRPARGGRPLSPLPPGSRH